MRRCRRIDALVAKSAPSDRRPKASARAADRRGATAQRVTTGSVFITAPAAGWRRAPRDDMPPPGMAVGCSRGGAPRSEGSGRRVAGRPQRRVRGRRARRRSRLARGSFITRFGVPDVVIANAGISRVLTEE
jgi:hypothetical protein